MLEVMRDILQSRYLRSNVAHKQLARTSLINLIIKFSTSVNAFLVLWLVQSISVISSYTLPSMANNCAKQC